jgi:hypothetical protein
MKKGLEEDVPPPAYSVSEDINENSPLLNNTVSADSDLANVTIEVNTPPNTVTGQPFFPVPLQVVLESTNQAVPIRIVNGDLFLTVIEPVRMFCPQCNQIRRTVLSQQAKFCAYASCVAMFFFCNPFCFIPFCLRDCKEMVHKCEQCDYVLAKVLI